MYEVKRLIMGQIVVENLFVMQQIFYQFNIKAVNFNGMFEIILKLKYYKNYDLVLCLQKCVCLMKKEIESVKILGIVENLNIFYLQERRKMIVDMRNL